MSDPVAPPNIEQKKADSVGTRWPKMLLRHRHTFLLALQILKGVVGILRLLKDLFGGP